MNPFDVLSLSKVSTKCKRLVKWCSNHRKARYAVSLDFNNDADITLRGIPRVYYILKVTPKKEDDGKRKYEEQEHNLKIHTLWIHSENELLELKSQFDHLNEILPLEVEAFVFQMDKFKGQNKEIIDWVKPRAPSFYFADIEGEDVDEEDIKHLLTSLKFPTCLQVYVQSNGPHKVTHINLKQFYAMEGLQMRLWTIRMESEDLNTFLKQWIRMECYQNLCCLHISIETLEAFGQIIKDVHHEILDPENGVEMGGVFDPLHPGVRIVRNDGLNAKIGVVKCLNDNVLMVMETDNVFILK